MKTFALVGTGGRAALFIEALTTRHSQDSRLLALCDTSRTRLGVYNRRLREEWLYSEVPTYAATDFSQMLARHKPDAVIVCSPDFTHNDYIVRALEAGCEAVTEKPMTIDAPRCRGIFDAARRTGRPVRVCFNYRWQAASTQIRRLLRDGAIGTVKSVMMEYALDTSHGADYFRRWHSEKDKSGGLLVHKSTHHFDLVNWWIDAIPEEVFAWGKLAFYGRQNAVARGDEILTRYPRYTDQSSGSDPFALDLKKEAALKELYYDAETESGYIRDRNVFRDGITIEDTMAVLVKYRTGVVLTYSLNAFSSAEGYRVVFHGDRGRLEYSQYGGSHMNLGLSEAEFSKRSAHDTTVEQLRLFPHFKPGQEIPIQRQEGAHGGGDRLLTEQIFSAHPPPETDGRNAGYEQGAASILVGIAANESMKTGRTVCVTDLVHLRPGAVRLGELTA